MLSLNKSWFIELLILIHQIIQLIMFQGESAQRDTVHH